MDKDNVFQLDSHRPDPHLVVDASGINKKIYVTPISLIDDFINGEINSADIKDFDVIARCIFHSFLEMIE